MLHGEIIDALAHLDEPGPVKICRVVVEFYENQMAFEIESPCGTTRVSFFTAANSGLRGAEKLGITQKHVPEDLFSSAGLANVRAFINQALEWSPPPTAILTLPSRLIDVGGRPGQEDPRLVIPSEHPPLRDSAPTDVSQRRYIALSYCWGTPHAGGSQLLKTETSNLAEFKERIPLALFPPALRDAILLTRRVNVRYIWIDALCIVQDDRHDWEREAARMAAVYQNAYLTFCSTQGSCGDGFAQRPNETAEVPFSSHLAASDAGGMGIQGSYHLTRWMAENFEWDSRGWTMQEIYFSPRALLFSKMQTYLWDTHSAAEADEDGVRVPGEAVFQPESRRQWWAEQVIDGRSWRLDDDDDDADNNNTNPDLSRRRLYENWYGKMIAYSRRSLTFPADRLPAISALASRMQAKFDALLPSGQHENYVAGLWARDLPGGLLWSVPVFDADPAPSFATYLAQRTDPELYVAPSWSWACQDETAFFYGYGADFVALGTVEHVEAKPAGLDAFGRVRGGEVVVGGWMARVPWGYFEVNQVDREGMNYEAVRRDGGVRTGPGGITLMAPGGGEAEVEFDWWVEDERHAEYWPSGSFVVMIIGMSVYPEELVPASPEEGWELFRKAAEVKGEPGDRVVVQEDGEVARFDSIFVLGIVLHETEEPGVYLRAGYLRGSAFEDTLAELRDAEYRTVKII
ncbi:hypothetical protein BFW01_g10111 [Lasiodiplodia theobromae]|nr:hypothetical protein BFW01_g10111 [Lasiodiplodia theobromae]